MRSSRKISRRSETGFPPLRAPGGRTSGDIRCPAARTDCNTARSTSRRNSGRPADAPDRRSDGKGGAARADGNSSSEKGKARAPIDARAIPRGREELLLRLELAERHVAIHGGDADFRAAAIECAGDKLAARDGRNGRH